MLGSYRIARNAPASTPGPLTARHDRRVGGGATRCTLRSMLRAWLVASLPAFLLLVPAQAFAEGTTLDLGAGVQLELVSLPAMTLQQGSKAGSPFHAPDEEGRTVVFTKDLLVGRTLVTVGQWRRFVAETKYRTEAEVGTSGGTGWDGTKMVQQPRFNWMNPGFTQTDASPVVLVTFGDANAFTRWASGVTRRSVRLPTEPEWEAAARGVVTSTFLWGENANDAEKFAWFGKNADHRTHPVNEKPPNAIGLLDPVGNVWQWTADGYAPIDPASATDPAPTAPRVWAQSDKPRRVLKGGSWNTEDRAKLRPAARHRATDGSRNADFGFRVVVDTGAAPAPTPLRTFPTTPPSPAEKSPAAPQPKAADNHAWVGWAIVGGIVGIFGFIIGIIIFAVKRAASPGQAGGGRARRLAPGSPYRARLAPDGFWLDADAAPGTSVDYVAVVRGRQVKGWTRVSGNQEGTFIYTGDAPASVVFPSATSGSVAHGFMSNDTSTSTQTYDSQSSHSSYDGGSGWPSAY